MGITVADVLEILPAFGYTPTDKDTPLIRLSIQRALIHVRSFCNIDKIPDDLMPEVLRMSCGEFLHSKLMTGDLGDGGIVFPDRVSQITEGDTSVSLAGAGTEANNFAQLVDEMRHGDPYVLEHNRRVHWW